MRRSAREMSTGDVNLIIDYFLRSDPEFLRALGVDINKLPQKEEWNKIISNELKQPIESKKLYYLIWQINDIPVGHSHINDIIFGKKAYMHLHLWNLENRNKGNGAILLKSPFLTTFKSLSLKNYFASRTL